MKTSWLKIVLLLLCCAALAFEFWHFRSSPRSAQQVSPAIGHNRKPDFVLLPAADTATLTYLFGNAEPRVKSWEPTVGDVNDLEANLPQITALSDKFHDPNRRIDDPRQFFRQYLAIDLDGKKVILVNALCRIDPPDSNEWRRHLIDTLDGGKCFWKASYTPATHTFSNLFVNGIR